MRNARWQSPVGRGNYIGQVKFEANLWNGPRGKSISLIKIGPLFVHITLNVATVTFRLISPAAAGATHILFLWTRHIPFCGVGDSYAIRAFLT